MIVVGDGIVLGASGGSASIVVTAPTGSTVTCTTPAGIVLTAAEVGGTWTFAKLKNYGTYTITATYGASTKTQEVLVDAVAVFDVSINYNKVKNGNFASGYDNQTFVGTGSSTSYWYKSLIPYGSKNYLRLGIDLNQTYSAQQTVNFTGATTLGFTANIVQGSSICSFLVYVGSNVIYNATYGTTVGAKEFLASYSGNQTLKFMAKKTGGSGNALRVDITDIYVR